jgi:hypothetical protein
MGFVGTTLSWFIMNHFGRRTMMVWDCFGLPALWVLPLCSVIISDVIAAYWFSASYYSRQDVVEREMGSSSIDAALGLLWSFCWSAGVLHCRRGVGMILIGVLVRCW